MEEIVETAGFSRAFKSQSANQQAKNELVYTYHKAPEYWVRASSSAFSKSGYLAGGLPSIGGKSMGAVIKSRNKTNTGGSQGGNESPKGTLAAKRVRLTPEMCNMVLRIQMIRGVNGFKSVAAVILVFCDRTRQCGGSAPSCASYKSNYK